MSAEDLAVLCVFNDSEKKKKMNGCWHKFIWHFTATF